MKVKIKDLKPNPYRDMDNYPINQYKINALKQSIEQTGFWDNILARKSNSNIQIAYGHHRLEVLKQIMKSDDEVDIPVKDLSDALMIQIMAKENGEMDEWKTSPAVTDETVIVAKKFLEEHPEELKKLSLQARTTIVGVRMISKFLGWNESRVGNSLERLKAIDDGILEKEIIKQMPTERHAREFTTAIKKDPLPKETQKQFAKEISESFDSDSKKDQIPSREIHARVLKEKWSPKKKEDAKEKERKEKMLVFEQFVRDTLFVSRDLIQRVKDMIRIKKELGNTLIINKIDAVSLTANFETLHELLTDLLNIEKNE